MNLPGKLSQKELDARLWLERFNELVRDGRPVSDTDRLLLFRHFVETGRLATTQPLLPVLLNLKGRPYTLANHFPFEPLFFTRLIKECTLKCARQVSKSTSQAADAILFANSVPHTTTLFVTPLYEQIRRFSSNYVGEFIDQSPVKALWSDTTTNNSVLQRSFRTKSKMVFSFALLDANRVRGVTSDRIKIDEIQDIDADHIPIINETMSHSEWGTFTGSGTPKTLDNTIEGRWQRSSMAEWFVPCFACGHQNIPSIAHDLADMLGPYDPAISEARPGTICTRCKRPVNPRYGRWVHHNKDRAARHVGLHVPQIIMPLHYARPDKWADLLMKREVLAPNVFHNEVLGESYDVGAKLVSLTEIQAAACLPWTNNPTDPDPEMLRRLDDYPLRVLGVDWGGGGKDGVSYTTLALLGWRADGAIDCLWGRRLLTPHDHLREAEEILNAAARFKVAAVAHDYTGAGALRETYLFQRGMALDRILAIAYVRAASHNVFAAVPSSLTHPRFHYQADKTRTLLTTTNCLKLGRLRFFQDDYRGDEAPGLLRDFLALIDEKVETASSGGIYVIKRQDGFSDDFAHAVNLGCCALWHAHAAWPDFAEVAGKAGRLTRAQVEACLGTERGEPDDMGGFLPSRS
jgi:hypothetical protein